MMTDFLFGVYYVLVNTLQAIGKSVSSFIANISRQGLIYIPLAIMLNKSFHEDGLAYAQPVADIPTVILSVTLTIIALSQYKKSLKEEAL